MWQILEPHPQRKYYLSRKACLGILRRARKRGKELPATLKLALEMQSGLRMIDLVILAQMGLIKAYHINQRNEGIDLGDTAGALMATSNLQMQTFVAGFSAGAGASAGGIGYREGVAPTLKAGGSGNSMPTVLCINDQGGERMDVTVDKTVTLRAQMDNHQPLVFESHGMDARYRQMGSVAPAMSARYGTGGNNVPLVGEQVFCITGNAIDREPENGGNGIGYQENVSYTLTGFDRHAVCSVSEVVGALCKGATKRAQEVSMWSRANALWISIPASLPATRIYPFCSSAALRRWNVRGCRAFRMAGQISPARLTAHDIRRWATAWPSPAWIS